MAPNRYEVYKQWTPHSKKVRYPHYQKRLCRYHQIVSISIVFLQILEKLWKRNFIDDTAGQSHDEPGHIQIYSLSALSTFMNLGSFRQFLGLPGGVGLNICHISGTVTSSAWERRLNKCVVPLLGKPRINIGLLIGIWNHQKLSFNLGNECEPIWWIRFIHRRSIPLIYRWFVC